MTVQLERGQGEGGHGEAVREERRNTTAVFAALPGSLLAAASVVALTMAVFGRYPMWPHREFTLAEAAGARDEAEVVRLIELGHDPNAPYPVRPGLLFERRAQLTPFEAAVINNDAQIAAYLLANGATLDSPSWVALRCFAGASRVASLLDEHRPVAAVLDCPAASVSWSQSEAR